MREITRDTTARPLGRHSVFGEIRSRAYNIICILRRGYRRGSASAGSKVKNYLPVSKGIKGKS